MQLILTCPDETKDVLVRELTAQGAENIEPGFRSVSCTASPAVFYRLHLNLRSASRILRVIKDVPAQSGEMLYDQARRIAWEDIFDVTRSFAIEGIPTERGPNVPRANDISKRVREGLQERFRRTLGMIPKVDPKEPKVMIVAFLRGGRCMLSLDTCGKAMHKRGYRLGEHPAPLKETLAASLLEMAGYNGEQVLLDPMCGSGTLAIEAAMLALGKAPLIHRKKGEFQFEWLKDFDRELWRRTQDELRQSRLSELKAPIYASDISQRYVDDARSNALRARVEKYLQFSCARFQDLTPPAAHGLLIANLPYGGRLGADDPGLAELYKEIGDTLKKRFSGWRAALLVAEDAPWKHIGLKTSRRIPVLNGSISCRLLIYDLYQGSRKKDLTALDTASASTNAELAGEALAATPSHAVAEFAAIKQAASAHQGQAFGVFS